MARLFRNDEALACHEQILQRSPKNEQGLEERVRLLGILGHSDEAFELQSKAFEDEQFAEQYHQEGLQMLNLL